jgi:hypothetical protein
MKRFAIFEFRTVPCFIAAILAALAIAMHAPGQLSYDSVTQLYEASIGRSVSWNPPFMSALLNWLGGGMVASSIFVALNACASYGAFVIVIRSVPRMSIWGALFCSILVTNPVVFAYVGILWKDVLFGSWAVLTFAMCVAAQRTPSRAARFVLVALVSILLGTGALIRQQGIFMAPLLLLAPLGITWTTWRGMHKVRALVVSVVLFVLAWAVAGHLVNRTIIGNDDRAIAAAPAIMQTFDIAGMVVRLSPQDAKATFPGLTGEDYEAIRQRYTPDRVDFLDIPTLKPDLLRAAGSASLTPVWLNGIREHPTAYVRHRISTILSLLDLHDINKCLPIQVGIEGPADYLRQLGLNGERSGRAQFLYAKLHALFAFPVWQNWLYVLIMVTVTGIVAFKKSPVRLVNGFYLFGLWAFVGSFLPAAIACDFRYLYPIIPPIMAILMTLAPCSSKRPDRALPPVEQKRDAIGSDSRWRI